MCRLSFLIEFFILFRIIYVHVQDAEAKIMGPKEAALSMLLRNVGSIYTIDSCLETDTGILYLDYFVHR